MADKELSMHSPHTCDSQARPTTLPTADKNNGLLAAGMAYVLLERLRTLERANTELSAAIGRLQLHILRLERMIDRSR